VNQSTCGRRPLDRNCPRPKNFVQQLNSRPPQPAIAILRILLANASRLLLPRRHTLQRPTLDDCSICSKKPSRGKTCPVDPPTTITAYRFSNTLPTQIGRGSPFGPNSLRTPFKCSDPRGDPDSPVPYGFPFTHLDAHAPSVTSQYSNIS
jgi:hypothetical protein